MSASLLTTNQQHHAMYHGGDIQKKAKAAMRRTATHLADVATDLERNLLGTFTPFDVQLLAQAARLMRQLADHTERAGKEADRIHTRIQQRRTEARAALKAAPTDTIADQIALITLGTHDFERRRLPFDCAKWGTRPELQTMLTQALDSLTWEAARSDRNPALFIDLKLATLPDLKVAHAETIRQIEHLAKVEADVRERAAA
jgi:hypothetical protein